jgi:molybdenum-dependent DNA-binding transcriptional regulator ModE
MKEKKHNYVYAVVNFTQRLAYIGSRGSNKPPLEDPYMGSFKKGLKFEPNKKIILSEHATRKEAYEAEREWQIKYDVAKNSLFVNRGILTSSGFSNAGKTGGVSSMRGKTHTEEAKKQIRNKLKHRFKSINVKNIDTEEVFKFDSIGQAARELGISAVQLSFLLRGEYKRTHNYCLETTDTSCFKVKFILKNASTGELVEATSQSELSRKIRSTSGEVCRVFDGSRLSVKGYCLPETDINLLGIKKRTIKLLNTFTKEVEEFNGVFAAAQKIGVSYSLVSMVLKGTRRRANQYVLPTETTPLCIDA